MTHDKYPTKVVDIPSKGWFYSSNHPLASGRIELRQPTCYHEDILNSQNLISKGIAISRFIEAMIATEGVNVNDLINGDYNYLQYVSRILLYGSQYEVNITCPNCRQIQKETIDLNQFDAKPIDLTALSKGSNSFEYTLPESKDKLTVKLLTVKDVEQLSEEARGMRKVSNSNAVIPSISSFLGKCIIGVTRSDGGTLEKPEEIRNYITNELMSTDSLALRSYIPKINPDIDTSFTFTCNSCNTEHTVEVPMDTNFFWPTT